MVTVDAAMADTTWLQIEPTDLHDAVLRIVADLHAAYGAGVTFEVQEATALEPRNFVLSDGIPTDEGGNAMVVGLWNAGELTAVSYSGGNVYRAVVAPGALPVLIDNARAFLHTFGAGPR